MKGDIAFDRLLGDGQLAGDPGVAVPLSHQLQYFQPPGSELADRVVAAGPADHAGHHLRIDHRTTPVYPVQSLHEEVDVEYPLLEQIPDGPWTRPPVASERPVHRCTGREPRWQSRG